MKKYLLLLALLCQVLAAYAQLTTSAPFTTACNGSPATISFSDASTVYGAGNEFTAQLSDENGSFWVPANIGSVISQNNSGSISIIIPVNAVAGTGYRLRVVASNPAIVGTDNGIDISIAPAPFIGIMSNSPVCEGSALSFSATSIPGATYSWSGPGITPVFGNQQNPVIPNAQQMHTGVYQVTATSGACTSTDTAFVLVFPSPAAPVLTSNSPVCTGQTLELMVDNPFTGMVYIWTGPNGFSAIGPTVSIPNVNTFHSGLYQAQAIQNGCTGPMGVVQVTVQQSVPITVTPDSVSICAGQSVTLTANGPAGTQYSWGGIGTFSSTTGAIVTLTPTTLPSSYQITTFFVHSNNAGGPGCIGTGMGTIYSGPGLGVTSNSPVQSTNTIFLTATSDPSGTQPVQWMGPNGFTGTGNTVFIPNASPTEAGLYTATYNSPVCGQLTVTHNVLVGNINTVTGTVYNDANNNGIMDAGEQALPNIIVQLQPGNYYGLTDSLGEFQVAVLDGSYMLSATPQNNQQVLNPTSLSVTVAGNQVSAGNNLGINSPNVQDLNVVLVPDFVPIPGFNYNYKIYLINTGQTTVSGQVHSIVPTLLSSVVATPSATISGDTLKWNFTNLAPYQQLIYSVSTMVPIGTALGAQINLIAHAEPVANDATPANNTSTYHTTVVGSYDPNDKAVSPPGPITPAQVAAGQELVYKIRFQNTGTYLAFNVLVEDTLSSMLDVSTFRMLSASHNYNVTLREHGILAWHFPNIMLPDSTTDEPNSHGYIQYAIKAKTNLQLGDNIENTAHIFFDFNEAIVTNTTSTVVALPNSTPANQSQVALRVFPNPNSGNFTLRLPETTAGELTVRVLNMLGQEVLQINKKVETGAFEMPIDLQNQPAGIYLVQVLAGGKTYSAKVATQR